MAARDVTAAQDLTYPAQRRGSVLRGEIRRLTRRSEATGLMALMTVCGLAMWTAVPVGGLWLASQFTESFTRPTTASALMTVVGIPALMALTHAGLAGVERRYVRLTGAMPSRRVPAYRRSISDSNASSEASVLDTVMVISVLVAIVAFAGWFLLLAGSSLLP